MEQKWLLLIVFALLLLTLFWVFSPASPSSLKSAKQNVVDLNLTAASSNASSSNENNTAATSSKASVPTAEKASQNRLTTVADSPKENNASATVSNNPAPDAPSTTNNSQRQFATVANWNLQVFGKSKAANATLMDAYAGILSRYDVAFVQEIRDDSGNSFRDLCTRIPTHVCMNSSRAGRTSSKEQIGILYRKDIELAEFRDFNPDEKNRWERPPIEAVFDMGGFRLKIYNAHLDPDTVPAELKALEEVVNDSGNTVVLGDFNADCGYYPSVNRTQFRNWTWVIPDSADTTVHATNCAYDRIFLNQNATKRLVGWGIYSTGINTSLSDHYPVWMNLSIGNN